MKIYIKIYKEVVKILIMFALVMLTNGTYYVCPLNDIYARKGNNCMLKNAQLRTKACIMAVNGTYVFTITLLLLELTVIFTFTLSLCHKKHVPRIICLMSFFKLLYLYGIIFLIIDALLYYNNY